VFKATKIFNCQAMLLQQSLKKHAQIALKMYPVLRRLLG